MVRDIRNYISNCDICKTTKPVNYTTKATMGNFHEVCRPWQQIYIDLLGPYPRTRSQNQYIFIVLDKYTKYVLLKPLTEATSSKIIKFLQENVFCTFSIPEWLFSDNGKQFTAKCFADFLNEYGVKHIYTPKYSPQANASERVNRSIVAAIRAYVKNDHKKWDEYLSEIRLALVNTIHSSTGFSPHYLVYGQHMIPHGHNYELLRELNLLEENQMLLVNSGDRLTLAQETVLKNLKEAYNRSSHQYNTRSKFREFNVDDKVYVKNFQKSQAVVNFNAKFAPKYIRAIVVRRIGGVAYELKDEKNTLLGIYHIKDIT